VKPIREVENEGDNDHQDHHREDTHSVSIPFCAPLGAEAFHFHNRVSDARRG
jgi:hypothetical protein